MNTLEMLRHPKLSFEERIFILNNIFRLCDTHVLMVLNTINKELKNRESN
ncbi:hypothetical protein NIES4106_62460 (plasmid) [Fischerella sp. NIES-4106]|nr:hypothetical protein NIES4106_62460 [Fischerella sp. NIES-4106]